MLLLGLAASGGAQDAGFFQDPGGEAASSSFARADDHVFRSRVVRADSARLDEPALLLNLFDDVVVRARVTRHGWTNPGTREWVGNVEGSVPGVATFVVFQGVLMGNVRIGDSTYSIRPGAAGLSSISQVDPSAASLSADDGVPMPASPMVAARSADALSPVVAAASEPNIIDLMVVYTPAARAAAGGTDAMGALLALGVSETNTAYSNSGAQQRLRLVHAAELPYVESGALLTDLTRLTNPYDGFLDAVHTWRDDMAADLVMLVVEGYAGTGMAWTLNRQNATPAEYAFSVVSRTGISPSYVFGHELGHNMGLLHGRSDLNDEPGWDPYSYAHRDPAGGWRTMMALSCAGGAACPTVLHFSNPEVLYNGMPTGVPAGSPEAADAARTLNETRTLVAAFRLPGLVIHDSPGLSHAVVNAAFGLSLSPSSAETVVAHYTTVDGTAMAGEDYVATSGTVTFTPGRTTHSLFVPLINDGVPEGAQVFYVQLTGASGARIADGVAVMTVRDAPSASRVPMYRSYNQSTDYHFFTTDLPSHGFAVNVLQFQDESDPLPFYVLNAPALGAVPLFRMYNPNLGRHFYTAGAGDRDLLMGIGMNYELDEGFVFPLAPTPPLGTVELFRLYNNNSGTHLFTADPIQRDAILTLFAGVWIENTSVGYVYATP